MRMTITGGGTGGHTSPAVAIVQELRRRDPQAEITWLGRRGAIEERVSAAHGVPFIHVPGEGWPRKNSLRRVGVAVKTVFGLVRAAWAIARIRPDFVVGVGGYVSLPVVFAAQLLGRKTVIHEQNKRLGMANRLLARRASLIFLSYEDTIGAYPKNKARVVGNPVRAGFVAPPSAAEARQRFGLAEGVPVVLVSGGSQGARTLNQAMAGVVNAFEANETQFIWMTGQSGYDAACAAANGARATVKVLPFIEDMVGASAAADVLVGRAGASSLAEIAVLGKPSILIPFPFATDNHQEHNARAFEAAGASVVMLDGACTAESLTGLIRELVSSRGRLQKMGEAALTLARPEAAREIVDGVMGLLPAR